MGCMARARRRMAFGIDTDGNSGIMPGIGHGAPGFAPSSEGNIRAGWLVSCYLAVGPRPLVHWKMKPASFDYLCPTSFEEALDAKVRHGEDARFLAGGQSLVPAMNFRMAQPRVIIDLNGIVGGAGIEVGTAGASIGALARYRSLE